MYQIRYFGCAFYYTLYIIIYSRWIYFDYQYKMEITKEKSDLVSGSLDEKYL